MTFVSFCVSPIHARCQTLRQRVKIVLACGAGETNTTIAKRMGVTGMTVGNLRKRYREFGIQGLHGANGFRVDEVFSAGVAG